MQQSLLGPGDPAPATLHRAEGQAPVLITCDHASHRVPASLGTLGLPQHQLLRHIGWDIGAAAVALALGERLDAPAIVAGYSRLVIDCNRDPHDPTSIPAASDGTEVPGNRGLSEVDRAARRTAIFDPYHAMIDDWLAARGARGDAPALLSVHSFTPEMNGQARPWQVGILWDDDPRIPVPLLEALRREADLVVGDNEPYSARLPEGYTVRQHAVRRGLPHVAIELRQDLIADEAAAQLWAARLAAALAPILARGEIYYARV